MLSTKKCIGCGDTFDISNFYSKQSRCKKCHKAKTKQYAKDNPHIVAKCRTKEHNRKYNLLKYKLTPENYDELYDKQQGKCLVCGKHQSLFKRRLVVDHNHMTGKVRGLLCNTCNCALGYVKESVEVLEGLIKYVKTYC